MRNTEIEQWIDSIKELIEQGSRDEACRELKRLADTYDEGLHELTDDILTDEGVTELMRARVAQGDEWGSIKCMLEDIKWHNDEFYYLEGDGNVSNITENTLWCLATDAETTLADLIEEQRSEL